LWTTPTLGEMLYLFGGYNCTSKIRRESSLTTLYDNVVDVFKTSDISSMSKTNTLSGDSPIDDISPVEMANEKSQEMTT
jgi:hypothetical protein